MIAENIWRSVDSEGHYQDSLYRIVDHRFTKDAIKQGFLYNKSGQKQVQKTTCGVQL